MIATMFHNYFNLGEFLSFSPKSYIKLLLSNNPNKPDQYCWQDVPEDIMEIILDRLPLLDRIRLRVFSRSWAAISRQKAIDATPRIPLMILPQQPGLECHHLSFYDLFEGNMNKLKLLKELYGAFCCGSSKGWLIMVKQINIANRQPPRIQVFLFNPVSGVNFQLPSPTSAREGIDASRFFAKIKLSCADISNCIVAALVHDKVGYLLTVCRPRDKQWSIILEKDKMKYSDILFYKGTLCAWIWTGIDQVTNITHKLAQDDEEISLTLIPNLTGKQDEILEFESLHNEYEFEVLRKGILFAYLVESNNGELLLIIKIADVLLSEKCSYWKYRKTSGFEVFKIDVNSGNLSRLYNLDDDQVIFLSSSGSLSVSARDLVGFRGNCIYFVENFNYFNYFSRTCDPIVSRESGVYYLDTERTERLFPSIKLPLESSMSWFLPNSICGRSVLP